MQASRMFEMLYMLLERERMTASELAQRLEVSVRTVYRDAQALSEAGVPVYAERGKGGGIAILPSYKLSKSLLSEAERRSILASLQAATQSGAEDGAVLRKLRAFFGTGACDWVQIDFADWSGTQDHDVALLKEAILESRVLAFDYYGESGEKTERVVCPLRLWFKGQAWYLRAYCLARRAVRTFKLSRLKRPRIVPGTFPPEALDARAQDKPRTDWPEPPFVHLRMLADACMAYRVFDDFSESAITRRGDGSFLIDARVPPGAWIVSIVLSYGPHAQVLEPPELREEIRKAAENLLARYNT
ncbi:MAG: helix-turn-helix transcriptional regulator [Candidatus Ventricola sp.]